MTLESGAYLAALVATACIALLQKSEPMRRTIIALAGAWILNWGFCTLFDVTSPWLWFIAVDTLAATVILWHPAAKAQAVIGTCFLVQIATNIGYGANLLWNGYNYDAELLRWTIDYRIGFAKLALVGAWGLWNARSLYRDRRRRRAAIPRQTDR
jgi:hypothetical protein